MKTYPSKINPSVKAKAHKFGVVFRVAKTPRAAKIYGVRVPKNVQLAYFGQGVIWVRSETDMVKEDFNIACLHELGHAILDFFSPHLRITNKMHEVKANAIALFLAADLGLPVSHRLLKTFEHYTEVRSVRCWSKS